MNKKALWIAEQLDCLDEDVYDVLLGNITQPTDFVSEVFTYANAYDMEMKKWSLKVNS
jgi:hypothetical protein